MALIIGSDTSFLDLYPASASLSSLPSVQTSARIARAASHPAKSIFFLRRANPIKNSIQMYLNQPVNPCFRELNNSKANPIFRGENVSSAPWRRDLSNGQGIPRTNLVCQRQ
jgi:hypothetical protein